VGKVAVFGVLICGGKVYVKIVPETKAATFMPVITRKIATGNIVYTDSYRIITSLM